MFSIVLSTIKSQHAARRSRLKCSLKDLSFSTLFYASFSEDPTANKDAGQETESIPEYTAEEEREDNRLWRTVVIGEQEQRIDMKVIEPYKRVISHGGSQTM